MKEELECLHFKELRPEEEEQNRKVSEEGL